MCDLRADRGGQAIAHRAKPAARQPAHRPLEPEMLRRPHLMLADLGRDDRVMRLAEFEQASHGMLGHDDVGALDIIEAALRPPAGDVGPPWPVRREGRIAECHEQRLQNFATIARQRDLDGHDLADLAGVDVDMDLACVGREAVEPARHPVVEPRPDADHHVAAVHSQIGFIGAMHSGHAEPLRRRSGKGAKPHQRTRYGRTRQPRQLAQPGRSLRARIDHAAARIENRAPRRSDQRCRRRDRSAASARGGGHRHGRAVPVEQSARADQSLHILGHFDQHRAGSSVERHVRAAANQFAKLRRIAHRDIILGRRPRQRDHVGFLEAVGPDQRTINLSREAQQRHRIHQRVS